MLGCLLVSMWSTTARRTGTSWSASAAMTVHPATTYGADGKMVRPSASSLGLAAAVGRHTLMHAAQDNGMLSRCNRSIICLNNRCIICLGQARQNLHKPHAAAAWLLPQHSSTLLLVTGVLLTHQTHTIDGHFIMHSVTTLAGPYSNFDLQISSHQAVCCRAAAVTACPATAAGLLL